MSPLRRSAVVLLGTLATVGVAAGPAQAAVSYTNCPSLQKSYPHGIGRANAHDATSRKPVTTFRRDTKGYNLAISRNGGLDRDHDGIACEKA